MQQHVHAELIGGPEDGREFIVPALESDLPLGQFTFPAEPSGTDARYDRCDRRADGVWRYQYINA